MYEKRIKLKDFRNYEDLDIKFNKKSKKPEQGEISSCSFFLQQGGRTWKKKLKQY